jgi:tetratricopeptide (TPR) repeat protein
LVLGLWGCVHFTEKWGGEWRLARAGTLLAEGKYDESIREAKEVLRLYPRFLGDEALFRMGLIYAYPGNPDQDYERSLKCFQGVIKEYPQSKLKDQAKVWTYVLQVIMDKDRKIGELKGKNSRMGKTLNKEREKVKELESQVERLQTQVERLQTQVEKLNDQLLRLKEIDLGIEKKKSREKDE